MSELISTIRTIPAGEWLLGAFCFVGLVAPGVLSICIFAPSTALQLPFLSLLLIALSLTTPFFVLFLASALLAETTKSVFDLLVYTLLALSFTTYIMLFLSAIFDFSWKCTLILLVFLDLALAHRMYIHLRKHFGRSNTQPA